MFSRSSRISITRFPRSIPKSCVKFNFGEYLRITCLLTSRRISPACLRKNCWASRALISPPITEYATIPLRKSAETSTPVMVQHTRSDRYRRHKKLPISLFINSLTRARRKLIFKNQFIGKDGSFRLQMSQSYRLPHIHQKNPDGYRTQNQP